MSDTCRLLKIDRKIKEFFSASYQENTCSLSFLISVMPLLTTSPTMPALLCWHYTGSKIDHSVSALETILLPQLHFIVGYRRVPS